VLQGTRSRRRRIPPFRRRELPGIYLAVLVFGLVAPLLPPLGAPTVSTPVVAPAPPAEPPPVQVQLVAPAPVVPRAALLNRLADSHTVALTFDDGPDPRWTPQILGILQQHGAVATFCMVSRNVAGQEALVRRITDAGMRLCDHSHTHDELLPDRDPERIADEVVGAGQTLSAAAGGAPVDWFRAPGGNWSTEVAELSVEHGMQPLSWNIDPRDWERPGAAAIVAAVQQQIAQQAPDGPIVLLHDGGGSREQTVEALRTLIPWLAEQGYRFGFPVP
jgi:peptidoglycan/xylan/chitin deacetylase (PgdA/CDA1 family)